LQIVETQAESEKIKKTHIVIAANKTDLPTELWKVKDFKAENAKLALMGEKINLSIPSMGVSAKEGINIEELFTAMAELIVNEKSAASTPSNGTKPSAKPVDGGGCCRIL